MRKILLVLALTLGTLVSNAQLNTPSKVIGEYNSGDFFGKIQSSNGVNEWIYSNLEKNKRGNKYTIKFKGDSKLIEELYTILNSQMNKPYKTEYSFTLGDKNLNLFTTDPSPVNGSGLLIEIDDTYFSINQSQLNKLFGK